MTDISEAERLALIARLQTQLVNEQADLIENQDDGRVHHGHSRRHIRPLHTATILQFTRRSRS
jgi:hypothetical protein